MPVNISMGKGLVTVFTKPRFAYVIHHKQKRKPQLVTSMIPYQAITTRCHVNKTILNVTDN